MKNCVSLLLYGPHFCPSRREREGEKGKSRRRAAGDVIIAGHGSDGDGNEQTGLVNLFAATGGRPIGFFFYLTEVEAGGGVRRREE